METMRWVHPPVDAALDNPDIRANVVQQPTSATRIDRPETIRLVDTPVTMELERPVTARLLQDRASVQADKPITARLTALAVAVEQIVTDITIESTPTTARRGTMLAGDLDNIRKLYGTGPGKVLLHLDPRYTPPNTATLRNKGGAGVAYDATGVASAARTDNFIEVDGAGHLALASPLDLQDVRLFIVLHPDLDGDGLGVLGSAATSVTLVNDGADWALNFDGGALDATTAAFPRAIGETTVLEIEYRAGLLSLIRDGKDISSVVVPDADFPIDQIGIAPGAAGFVGGIGEVVALDVSGSGDHAGAIQTVRARLAARPQVRLISMFVSPEGERRGFAGGGFFVGTPKL